MLRLALRLGLHDPLAHAMGGSAVTPPPPVSALLIEAGDFLLLESGDKLLME